MGPLARRGAAAAGASLKPRPHPPPPPPVTDRKVRFAVLGCGRIAGNHLDAICQARRPMRTGRCVRHRSDGPGRGRGANRSARLRHAERDAGEQPGRLRRAGHAERPARPAGAGSRRRRPPRDDREADGDALGRRPGDGARLRRRRRAPVRRQAEPPQPHAAAAQAGGRCRAASAASTWSPSTCSGPARRPTTTAPRGAAPGSSTAARS